MQYAIWYMRPDFFRVGIHGSTVMKSLNVLPVPGHLERTHTMLKSITAKNPDEAFLAMQAEKWSPKGEARPLIEQKGLKHTSMSVGDIMVEGRGPGGKVLLVDITGFYELGGGDAPVSG